MSADLITLKDRLEEASIAMHQLSLGKSVVEFWRDGRRVKFSSANSGDLKRYIQQLKEEIAACEAEIAGNNAPRRRAFGVAWGG